MRILNETETLSWLSDRGIGSAKLHKEPGPGWRRHDFILSTEFNQRARLAQFAVPFPYVEDEVLLIFAEVGIFPSFERPYMLKLLRDQEDDHEPLDEREGHLFASSEFDRCEALCAHCLNSLFSFILTYSRHGVQIQVDHDDGVTIFIKEEFTEQFAELVEALESCKA